MNAPLISTSLHRGDSEPNRLLATLLYHPKARHIRVMKHGIWLYLAMLDRVHSTTGQVQLDLGRLSADMGLAHGTICSWLGHLRKENYLGVTKQHGALTVTISGWTPSTVEMTARSHEHQQPSDAMGANDQAFATMLAGALQDTDNYDLYLQLVGQYSRAQLNSALESTLRVPRAKIKKSRAALFHYLLKR
jgi:hypothetical protein